MSGGTLASVAGRQLWTGLKFLIAMTIVLGIVYPLVVLGVGQVIAKDQADGSMVTDANGDVVGSSLIGQQFEGDEWFAGRPSAAGDGYDALSSGGSNLAADSPDLLALIDERRAEVAAANGVAPEDVPADALTASASGLDPHISPAYALLQVNRVATARGLDPLAVRALVEEHIQGPTFGFLGADRVNVLELNLALQRLQP
ncbi:potassium-transporting ATPase subunit KdpC [Nakamurella sp. YIM 132087]|uniref:Potassium-transporting ATPase KdpC subunit n=1 Tax=Nakamurella alba TaxID=2665158 RepID=A0A7K1FJY5_9ACTN|nr:potassium-transporting ATPase subunit KdpC [Nakamurella alba]